MNQQLQLVLKRPCALRYFRSSALYFRVERLKDGNIHMRFFSRSGYRPFINPHPSLGNLLLDITPCSISFRCRFVLFLLLLILGLGFGFGIW